MTRRRSLVTAAYAGVLALAFVLRYRPVHYAAQMLPLPDALEYAVSAVTLLQRGVYALKVNHVAYPPEYPFGFPLLLAPFYALFGPLAHNGAWASLFYGLALLAVAMLIARRLFGDGAALLAGIIIATSRQHVVSSQEIMSDATSAMLALVAAYVLLRIAEGDRRYRHAFVAGLLAGLVVCVRLGDVAVAAALGLAVVLAYGSPWRLALRALLTFTLGAAPWAVALLGYNWLAHGDPLRSGYAWWHPFFQDNVGVFSLRYLTSPSASDTLPTLRYYSSLLLGLDSAYYLPPFVLAIAAGLLAVLHNGSRVRKRALTMLGVLAVANLAIYAVYRYQYPRFAMLACTIVTVVGAYGMVVLARAVGGKGAGKDGPARALAGAALALIAGGMLVGGAWSLRDSYALRVTLRGAAWFETTWRYDAVRFLNERLPDNALIVSALPGPYVEHYVIKETQRTYVPITRGGVMYAGKRPARQWLVADESPGELEALIDSGRSVFLLADPLTAEQTKALAALRARFAWREDSAVSLDRWGDVTSAILYQLLPRE